MEYELLYDFSRQGPLVPALLAGLVVLALGMFFLAKPGQVRVRGAGADSPHKNRNVRIVGSLVAALGISLLHDVLSDHGTPKTLYQSGQFQEASGSVRGYTRTQYRARTGIHFFVGQIPVVSSNGLDDYGLYKAVDGLQDGDEVKIAYVRYQDQNWIFKHAKETLRLLKLERKRR